MWIVASAQSTIRPFIQTFVAPGKLIRESPVRAARRQAPGV
jgi:hypothetical protein